MSLLSKWLIIQKSEDNISICCQVFEKKTYFHLLQGKFSRSEKLNRLSVPADIFVGFHEKLASIWSEELDEIQLSEGFYPIYIEEGEPGNLTLSFIAPF